MVHIRLTFNPEKLNEHRWSDKALKENLFSAVLSSGPRFLEEKPEIEKKMRKYPANKSMRHRVD